MADDVVAALNQYATTTELALPRAMSAQLMAIGPAGYISGVWADWTVLPTTTRSTRATSPSRRRSFRPSQTTTRMSMT